MFNSGRVLGWFNIFFWYLSDFTSVLMINGAASGGAHEGNLHTFGFGTVKPGTNRDGEGIQTPS